MKLNFLLILVAMFLGLILSAGSCDEDSDDSSSDADTDSDADADSDADSDADADGDGPCSAANAGTACGEDCIYDPAAIDCDAACANVITVCDGAECDELCEGEMAQFSSDAGTCALGCTGTTTLSCTNLVFGCYQEFDNCTDIGECINNYM